MLNDITVRNAKPRPKPYKLADSHGLYLSVRTSGAKLWRLKYRQHGKEQLASLGRYPQMSLRQAREAAAEVRAQRERGIDPAAAKRAKNANESADSFAVVAREWLARHRLGVSEKHGDRIERRLERDLLPWLGKLPVREVTAADVLECVRRVEKRGIIETTHRVLRDASMVLRYATATQRADGDSTQALRGALMPIQAKHFATILEPGEIRALMHAIDDYPGSMVVRCALQVLARTFVRPGELRGARWKEIDLDGATWNIPAARTKTTSDLVVPLSTEVVAVLRGLQPLTGKGDYVFAGSRPGRPISDMTINQALRSLGYGPDRIVGHGFRAMARTILDETLGFRPDWIEAQLGHRVRDPLGRAYNRTAHLAGRRTMMQAWSDYLSGLAVGETPANR